MNETVALPIALAQEPPAFELNPNAHRIASDVHREWTRDELMRLEPTDVLAGDPVSDRS